MAVGVSIPGALSLEVVGAAPLADADLPLPDDPAFAIFGLILAEGASDPADPRPDSFEKLGLRGPANDLTFLDRIHILPRARDLGAVISEQEILVEVWNAYRTRTKTLDEITVEGPA